MKSKENATIGNIYRLNGRVPLLKAIPFGLQHVLAMFVSNLTMFVAGIATLIQLYPVWKVGAKLPIVMGVSFTFVTILSYVGGTYGYPTMIGAVLVGGVCEGVLGLFAKYWKRFITPVVRHP